MQKLQIKNSPANLQISSQEFSQNNQYLQGLFSWWVEVLLEEFLATKKSLNTKKSYSQDLNDFFEKYNIFIVEDFIEKSMSWEIWNYIWDFLENFKKSDEKNLNRVLNPRTINRKLFSLSSFYNFLNKKYNFKHNPTKVFTALKTWKHSSTDSLQTEEMIKMLEKMKENYLLSEDETQKIVRLRDYLIFIFLSFSLRRDEISKLKWSDLKNQSWNNWVRNYLEVYQKWWEIKQIPVPDSIFRYLWILRKLKNNIWIQTDFIISPTRNNRTWDLSKPLSWDMIYSLVEKNYQKFYLNKNSFDDKKIFSEKIKNFKTDQEKFKKRIYRAKKFLEDEKNFEKQKKF
jgi:site-specific recombinase XerD